MQKIDVYDSSGNNLTNLVQWDENVNVYIQHPDISKAYNVHFFNSSCCHALVVESSYSENKLKVKIPNVLLTQALPIMGYVYITKDDESKSLYGFSLTVRKRPQPSNYVYVDSKDYISVEDIRDITLNNVKSYGATGDGVTDDTDAIFAAMSKSNALYFPAGTYLLNRQIDLTDDIFWHGDGEKTIIKLLPLDKARPEEYEGRTVYNSYILSCLNQPISIELHDMVLDANKDAFVNDIYNNGASKYDHTVCIDAQKPSSVVLDNVTIKNALIEGAYIWAGGTAETKVQISNCKFIDNGYNNEDASGLHCEGNHKRTTITNCRFENNGFHGLLLACNYANVSNIVTCENKHDGIMLWGGASYNNLSNIQSFNNRAGLTMKANYSGWNQNDDANLNPVQYNRIVNLNSYGNTYGLLLGNNANNTFLSIRTDDDTAIALCNVGTCTGEISNSHLGYVTQKIKILNTKAVFNYTILKTATEAEFGELLSDSFSG